MLGQPGVLLDAFAGMGAVGQAIAPRRPLWTNDAQIFAQLAAGALFTSSDSAPTPADFVDIVEDVFEHHCTRLRSFLEEPLLAEEAALSASSFVAFNEKNTCGKHSQAKVSKRDGLFTCFSDTYAWTYFGLHQCIEIDSARFAIDSCLREGCLSLDAWRWALVSLGRASLRVATTTGHFAQYLRVHERTFRRIQRQRRRNVWSEWLIALGSMRPCGSAGWREMNRATCADSLDLLANDPKVSELGVVYCDPPYTDDQYSRFYHVLETLVSYDYPEVTGAGQYRQDRFTTPFSLKGQVEAAFKQMIGLVAAIGADLIISYPTNGLLHNVGGSVIELLKCNFASVSVVATLPHVHSTFGASKGSSKADVVENIYLARG